MATAFFITHPEVVIDPEIPVPDWALSPQGLSRLEQMVKQPWVASLGSVWASAEKKAQESASLLATHLALEVNTLPALGENDRSATGYLPPDEFQKTADAFFAQPDRSIQGWETALDAQARIVEAVNHVLAHSDPDRDLAMVSHGGVGALLLCHLKQAAISRDWDQTEKGGGSVFSFNTATWQVLFEWRPIDG